jgi:hypothetical protein
MRCRRRTHEATWHAGAPRHRGICHCFGLRVGFSRFRSLRLEMPMSQYDRIEALRAKHAHLEHEIDDEIHRPLPNPETITDLKRRKLRIKDEIFELEHNH